MINSDEHLRLFSEKTQERAEKYYQEGRVSDVVEVRKGKFLAQVQGRELYSVRVELDGISLKEAHCDCPIGEYGNCKHVLAVLKTMAHKGTKKKSIAGKISLPGMLKAAKRELLEGFILDLAEHNKDIYHRAEIHFSPESVDPYQQYKKLITSIFSRAKGRQGFVEYSKTYKLTTPIMDMLEKADGFAHEEKWMMSFGIARAVFERLPDFANSMDDSDGDIMLMFGQVEDVFTMLAKEASNDVKKRLFEYAAKEIKKEKYQDWDFAGLLVDIITATSESCGKQEEALGILNEQINYHQRRTYGQYTVDDLIQEKIRLLKKMGRQSEAVQLTFDHIERDEIRELMVDEFIANEQYGSAKMQCMEALSQLPESLTGNLVNWDEKLLVIAQKENSIQDIRKYSLKLFSEIAGSMAFYRMYKSTFNEEEWPVMMEALLNDILGPDLYPDFPNYYIVFQVFIEEKLWTRMLQMLQQLEPQVRLLEKYTPHFEDEFPTETLALFKPALLDMAEATGRQNYKSLARVLKRLKKLKGGHIFVQGMIMELKKEYSNRPAFKNELDKVFK